MEIESDPEYEVEPESDSDSGYGRDFEYYEGLKFDSDSSYESSSESEAESELAALVHMSVCAQSANGIPVRAIDTSRPRRVRDSEPKCLGDLLDYNLGDTVRRAMGPSPPPPPPPGEVGETMGKLPYVNIGHDWRGDVLLLMWLRSRHVDMPSAPGSRNISGPREINVVLSSPQHERVSLIQHLTAHYSQQVHVISRLPSLHDMQELHKVPIHQWNRDVLIIDFPCMAGDSQYATKLNDLCAYLTIPTPTPHVSCAVWLFVSTYPLGILTPHRESRLWEIYFLSDPDTMRGTASRLVGQGKP